VAYPYESDRRPWPYRKAEIESILGHVAGDPDTNGDGVNDRGSAEISQTVCVSCHSLQGGPDQGFLGMVSDCPPNWKRHLTEGRLAEKVWSFITDDNGGGTCGW